MVLTFLIVLLSVVLRCNTTSITVLHDMFPKLLWTHSNSEKAHELGGVFLQNVDHFDISNNRTFYQRYYYNNEYFKSTSGREIVVLFVGGPSSLKSEFISKGLILDIAKELNALVVALEHRHFGKSITSSEYDNKELLTLTTHQALSDIVTFRKHIQKRFLLKNDEWISVGGTYGGALASWARIIFPHFIKASWASSAIVHLEFLHTEYLENTAISFSTNSVGGSQKCLANIDMAFKMLDSAALSSNDFSALEKKLYACQPTTNFKDVQFFLTNLGSPFAITAEHDTQYQNLNIEKLCQIMTKDEDPIDMLANVVKHWLEVIQEQCISTDFNMFTQFIKSKMPSSLKSWFYLKCRETGHFMACNTEKCPFTKIVNSLFQDTICSEVFGLSTHIIPEYIQYTNDYYGGKHPGGSRIIYTHGSLDPYISLGVMHNSTENEIYTIVMKDTSRVRDIQITDSKDTPEVVKTKQFILDTMKRWFTKQ